jgi:hypothetical protein
MFLFYVDSNPLITSWLKEQAPVGGDKFYSLATLKESGYFLFDLRPDVLVVDSEILKNEKEHLLNAQASYDGLFAIPLVTVGRESVEGNFGMELKGHIAKPINPAQFFRQVRELIGQTNLH